MRLSDSSAAAATGSGGAEGTETLSSAVGGKPEYDPNWGDDSNTPSGPSGAGGCESALSPTSKSTSGCSASASGSISSSAGAARCINPGIAAEGEGSESETWVSTKGGIDENEERGGGPECLRSCKSDISSGTVASGRHSSKPWRHTREYSLTAPASILWAISSSRMGPIGTSFTETCHSGRSLLAGVGARAVVGTRGVSPRCWPTNALFAAIAVAAAGIDETRRDAADGRRGGTEGERRRAGEEGRRARAVAASCSENGDTGSDFLVTSSKLYASPAGTVTSASCCRPSMRIL